MFVIFDLGAVKKHCLCSFVERSLLYRLLYDGYDFDEVIVYKKRMKEKRFFWQKLRFFKYSFFTHKKSVPVISLRI